MYKKYLLLLLFFSGLGSLPAQSFLTKNFTAQVIPDQSTAQIGTRTILAVMVEFQEDRDGTTVGNGKFGTIYSTNYGNDILDPLPHDKAYFEAHLDFAKNYFNKVSNGKLSIEYTVLPNIITVSQTMRNYSPNPGSNNFMPIADFSAEVWQLVDQANPGLNFNEYDIFLIFHAGVGRDITLPGSLGTDRDIPSVYLGLNTLRNIYNDVNFQGFPVSNNSFITNSMIIPETESREVEGFGGIFLYEITINGLIVASIGSYLGLPDLFDTETGLSAIGRFGLMDGQGIFAYLGVFPPAPSAWEKIYLGWEEPSVLSFGSYDLSLVADMAASIGDTTILKVPINSSEYYLIENRARDAFNNGAVITYVLNGDTLTKIFPKDTTGFQSFAIDSLKGVIIDVDEFDWAIPGSGVVIWHIDESIINAKINENKINTDKSNRGIDVEEADGIQDIGEEFTTILGDVIIGEGESVDLWFASNNSRFYSNRFSQNTRPNSNTNTGANSLITISNFSDIANRMRFRVSYGDSLINPLFSSKILSANINNKLTSLSVNGNSKLGLVSGSDLFIINNLGEIDTFFTGFSNYKISSLTDGNLQFYIGASGNILNVLVTDGNSSDLFAINVGEEITAPPVVQASNGIYNILIGTRVGKVVKYSLGNLSQLPPLKSDSIIFNAALSIQQIAVNESYISVIGKTADNIYGFYDNQGNSNLFDRFQIFQSAVTIDKNGNIINYILTNRNNLFTFIGNNREQFVINIPDTIKSFALGDIKQNGENYIVFTAGNNIHAINNIGASADNFPFADPLNIGFTGTPLIYDFAGDNKAEIISYTKDGRIYAIDGGTGKIVGGFPISVGTALSSSPVIYNSSNAVSFSAINDSNFIYSWNISDVAGKEFWSEELGNNLNTSSVQAAENINTIAEFFPGNRAYNYPNPVYEGETAIRYYVSEDSRITIKIFDIAGDLVAELGGDAFAGLDNETIWNVSDIQSGVYFAHIEAVGSSGKSESNIIKIAVVK